LVDDLRRLFLALGSRKMDEGKDEDGKEVVKIII
jgi:hypothetical protein